MPAIFYKDPDDTVDYFIPWDRWLRPSDPIVTSAVQIVGDSPELTIQSSTVNAEADGVTIWVTGGSLEETYQGFNTVTTEAGRVGKRRFTIHCTKIFTEKEG